MPRQTLPSLFSDASPFLHPFSKEMAQLFDQFRRSTAQGAGDLASGFDTALIPSIDIAESDEGLEISAEIPGVKDEDLDVSVSGEMLVIKGEKSSDREEKEKEYHLVERRYGSFRRQVPLGFVPEADAVKADFSNGVLKLNIQKPANTKAGVQKITVKSS
ncbi:MAG: Hsp20/alpha crystallin family protein [Pseudomonadota bacterium]